jgi:hypothetical protein
MREGGEDHGRKINVEKGEDRFQCFGRKRCCSDGKRY